MNGRLRYKLSIWTATTAKLRAKISFYERHNEKIHHSWKWCRCECEGRKKSKAWQPDDSMFLPHIRTSLVAKYFAQTHLRGPGWVLILLHENLCRFMVIKIYYLRICVVINIRKTEADPVCVFVCVHAGVINQSCWINSEVIKMLWKLLFYESFAKNYLFRK